MTLIPIGLAVVWGGQRLGWWLVPRARTDREVAEAAWRGTAEILNEWAEEQSEAHERAIDQDPDLAYEAADRSSSSVEVLRLLRRHESMWTFQQRDTILRRYVNLLQHGGRSLEELCDDGEIPHDIRQSAWRARWRAELSAWQNTAEMVATYQDLLLHAHWDHQRDLEVGPYASSGPGARGDVARVEQALAETKRILCEWQAKHRAADARQDALRGHPLARSSETETRMVGDWEREAAKLRDRFAEWENALKRAEEKTTEDLATFGPRNKRLLAGR